jgi:beta-glucosidase
MKWNTMSKCLPQIGWALFLPLGAAVVASSSCTRLESSQADTDGSAPSGGNVSASTSSSSAGTASGNSSSNGSGGNPASNSSGAGSSNGGSDDAGSGVVQPDTVVNPDASIPDSGQMACTNSSTTDPWSPGYSVTATQTSTAQGDVSQLQTTQQANIMRGTPSGCGGTLNYNDDFESGGASGNPMGSEGTIREIKFRDGPRGVCLVPYSTVHPAANSFPTGDYSTTFPSASARGAAFDMDLEQSIGEAIGDEIVAAGTTLVLAPVINILRHPAWGRSQETYGEDSFALGRLGTAFVSGAQQYVPACAKHFMAYNIERDRESGNVSSLDEQTAYESYGRHFEMVIQDGGVACVMAAYNEVQFTPPAGATPSSFADGTTAHCTSQPDLLTTMLRTTFGFKGFVVSDWWAMPGGQTCPSSDTEKTYTTAAVGAGLDLEMPWNMNYSQLESVATAAQILTGATRIATQQARFNTLAPNQKGLKAATTTFNTGTYSIGNNTAHIQLSYQAAIESMVLLKNSNNTLPISSSVKTIAVLGANVPYALSSSADVQSGTVDFATDVRTGDLGSSRTYCDPSTSTGPYAGIKAAAPAGVTVTSGSSATNIPTADFYVVVAGMTPEDEGEEYTSSDGSGGDRLNFNLDGKSTTQYQTPLITAVAALNKPMVVVLEGGSVIAMPWFSSVPAVVMAWYPGQDGGHALADLLFGTANFSGKLPVTWPSSWNDEPQFTGAVGGQTTMDYYVGYKYFDHYHSGYGYIDGSGASAADAGSTTSPAFPFGYGLSYTTFSYANLQIPCSSATTGSVVNVQADVTNTGMVSGDEVSFLFVSYPNTTQRRPLKELKGFHRATIPAGQTVRITIPLRVEDLKYWNATSHSWQWESGTVNIMVGGRSTQLPLTGTMTVTN